MVRRWVPALVLGGVWWWAVLRLALEPARVGLVEGVVAAGGWGLSLLPVHAAAAARRVGAGTPEGCTRADAGRGSGMAWVSRTGAWCAVGGRRITRAWPRRRSGEGSGRS